MKYLIALTLLTSTSTYSATLTDYRAYCTDTNPTDNTEYIASCVAHLVDTYGVVDED